MLLKHRAQRLSVSAAATVTRMPRRAPNVLFWILFKHLFASWRAEIIGFSLVCRLVLCRFFIYVHSTDEVFRHHFTSLFDNLVVCSRVLEGLRL